MGAKHQPTVHPTTPRQAKTDDKPNAGGTGRSGERSVAAESRLPAIAQVDQTGVSSGKGGGALRAIDQRFEVNPSNGTLALNLPLSLTKSRGELNPTLNLSYNSGAGNGVFGLGWHLPTESVTRKTAKEIPRYDESDTFLLSGLDDLVREGKPFAYSGSLGSYSVQRYCPRATDTQTMRIERFTGNDGDVFWRTMSAANVTKFFGLDAQSRIMEKTKSGPTRIFSWLLCAVFDPLGNAMHFTYKAENDSGLQEMGTILPVYEERGDRADLVRARHLKSIKYGNIAPARDLQTWQITKDLDTTAWMFEVVLDYGDHDVQIPTTKDSVSSWPARKDSFSSFTSGFEVRTHRLCRRMLLFHHFPGKLPIDDYLVRSYEFEYDENPTGSLLQSLVAKGHIWDEKLNKYVSQSMAPYTFTYMKMSALDSIQPRTMKPECLQGLPVEVPRSRTRWLDLNGEGTPGLLVQLDGVWYYQRNEGALGFDIDSSDTDSDVPDSEGRTTSSSQDFGPVQILDQCPALGDYGESYFEDLDGNGLQDLVVYDEKGQVNGYYESNSTEQWESFREFSSYLSFDPNDKVVHRVDLTGNGRRDVLRSMGDGMAWYASLGKDGFDSERACQGEDGVQMLLSQDQRRALFFVDATGDGLSDLFSVTNGRVAYCPNLGHGRFGKEIVMGNCPLFDSDDQFAIKRVHLLDIDGSGTTDMLYLCPGGGAVAYYNLCGNSWSEGVPIARFPQIDELSSVFTLDLLGNGTSCLCWAGTDGAKSNELVISYLDLSEGTKPHVLRTWSNGIGLSVSAKYAPSTKFYLQDERSGRPWKTKLPFPVHVVSRLTVVDEIVSTTLSTRYRYHDGYYDGKEKEFRGFGIVEMWKSDDVFMVRNQRRFAKPISYTKNWYHTGAEEMGLKASDADTYSPGRLQSAIPLDLSSRHYYDVFRAMKGKILRAEVYGCDQSDAASIPYTITESSYDIVLQGNAQGDEALVFRVHPRETLTTHHERQNGDTRLEHELVWETNTYGDVTKAMRAQYGKAKSDLYTVNARAAQRQHYIIYTENEFTKDIVGRDVDSYCTPLPASKTIFVIEDSPKSLLNIDSLRSRGLESIGGSLKVGQQTRTYYRSEDLSTRLPLGSREVYSIVDQHYQLALNAAMCKSLASVEGISVREIAIPSYLHDSCGYEQLNEDGCAWVPSPKVLWGSDEDSDGSAILNQARRSFLIPMRSSDAFGNTASVKLDEYSLFAVESTDAVKNVTTAEYDYRTAQAALKTDANGNRTQVKYDQFGEATMIARMGKVNEAVGDSLEDVPHSVSDDEVLSFISSPTQNAAANLLGSAGVRTLSCRNRLALTSVQKTLPTFRLELSRTQHFRDDQGEIAIKISYLDGHGTQVQQLSLSDWNGTEMQWCVTKHNVLDANGKKLLSAKPYISATHLYQSLVDSNQAYDISFLDVLQREVGTLFADRTWKKSCTTPWMRTDYDVGCNVLVSNPRLDPDVGFYFSTLPLALHTPTWHAMRVQGDEAQRDATTKSAGYGNNPHEAHFDSRGKEVEKVEKSKTSSRKSNVEYDAFGNAIAEADFLGRSVVRREFDYLGRCHITRSMDAGVQLVCFDVLGNTAFQCSSNKCQQRTVYDGLRRKVETWMLDASRDSEVLWSKTTYGDSGLGDDQKNLRGRVLEVSDQAGTRRNGVYDFKGNCLSTNTYIAQTYDVILDWSSSVDVQQTPYTTLRTFDAMNRITTLTDAAGRVSVRTFDLRGNLMSLFSSSESQPSKSTCHILSAVYSAEQQPLLVNYGNSSHAAYTYDEQTRRLTQRRTWRDDGTVLEDLTTTYDCLGRITSKVDAAHQTNFFRGTQAAPRRSYWYDSFGRLIKATGRETIQTGSNISRSQQVVASSSAIVSQALPFAQSTAISNYTEAYTYDDADNIQSIQHQSSDSAVAGWKRTYEYNESSLLDGSQTNNRLSQTKIGGVAEEYKYEGDAGSVGCMTSMPGFSRLGWDCNNRLSCSARQRVNEGVPETTWYVYNEDGRRMRKVVARTVTDGGKVIKVQKIKETIFLDSLEIYHTYNGDGQTAKTITHTSLIDPTGSEEGTTFLSIEDSVLLAEGPAVRVAPLFRYHVSESLETDDRGQVISYEEYSPFGFSVLLACRSDIEAPRRFRFAAYERDNETGLYACGDRYYAPWLGRWTSADPTGTADGHNVYAYVRNDPVNWTDPTGNCKEGQVDTRAGFMGELPVNNIQDHYTLARMIDKKNLESKSMVERAKLDLDQNKGIYAATVVKGMLGIGADLIPVAGPLVKAVINGLFAIHIGKKKAEQQQVRELEICLQGIRLGLDAAQKSNEKMVMEIGSKPISGDDKVDEISAKVFGTTAFDFRNKGEQGGAEANSAAVVDKPKDSSQQGSGKESVISNKAVGQKFYQNLLKGPPSSP